MMAKNEHIPLLHESLLNIARSATARDHEFPSCGAHALMHARSLSLALALSLSASLSRACFFIIGFPTLQST